MLNIGRLNRRIDIEQITYTPDGGGGDDHTWTKVATVWAQITPLSGKDVWYANQKGFTSNIKIIIRYNSQINSTMRIKYGTRYFEIDELKDIEERHLVIQLLCTEKKPSTF